MERLGSPLERVAWLPLEDAARERFAEPNIALLQRIPAGEAGGPARPCLGLEDGEFDHPAGLITKGEARAVAIARLRLRPDHCLWDLGAGSGAVAVEAAAIVTRGPIVALERDPQRCARIRENRRRFGVVNLEVVEAELPAGLDGLPRPDRIFIGGGGRRLPAILRRAAAALAPGGRIVVNTVLLESLQRGRRTLAALGMHPETLLLQASHGRAMPWGERLAPENPVWILSGQKAP
jgi:precorrin-6Y C5,15-methyltransferase (decarboxylating)